MTDRLRKALADLKTRQEKGTYTLCPRCGLDTMKPDLYTNALSRQADILVCDQCGQDESVLAWMNKPYSLYRWAALQPEKPASDFKNRPGKEVWAIICDRQAVTISTLYRRFIRGEDPEEIRFLAHEQCPGLIDLWTEPYHMKYECVDGPLTIAFSLDDDDNLAMDASLPERA